MRNEQKMAFKSISLLCVSLLCILTVGNAADSNVAAIQFTDEEKAYIAKNDAVSMCVDPDWAPFEKINENGFHEGIAADLINLVAQRVGLTIALYSTQNWEESLAASKEKRCQIMSFLNQTPAREKWLSFTKPIFYDQNIIITREEHDYIGNLHGLSGQSVALPRGTMVEERIHHDYPNLSIVLTENEQDAVALVSERKVDMTIRSLIVAAYAIKKEGLFNLKIAGQVPEMVNQLSIGVLKDETLLRNILDKGVATLTAQDRETISNKHVSIQIQEGIDYTLVWEIMGGGLVFLLIAIYWNRKLSTLNKELNRLSVTDKLTGLFNRVKIDDLLDGEIHRAQRFAQTFGLIMLDIDHFKMVNDTHGHQVGDQVLIDVAQILRSNIRQTDEVGRWGGEEFIIVCPQSDENGTFNLAEILRTKLATHEFFVGGHKTASFGVTAYRAEDTSKDIVGRADAALYQAKQKGRNQVIIFKDKT
jgi:diguanylate cyclase (GGDEF)-like protein